MKKRVFLMVIIMLIILSGGIYLYSKEKSYTPLVNKDFKMLFRNYNAESKKVCSIDFLGLSMHNELFELYVYEMNNTYLDTSYPRFIKRWESNDLTSNVLYTKWARCPIDTATMKLYEFNLTINSLNRKECGKLFVKELQNSKNYFSYIYFNELENYFLLYVPENKSLFYLRRKGF